MREIYFFIKCLKEITRDWKMLFFSLIFGPAFTFLFYAFYSNSQISYKILITNSDKEVIRKNNESINAGSELIKILKSKRNSDGSMTYNITLEQDKDKAMNYLKSRKYDVYLAIPEEFSKNILNQSEKKMNSKVKLYIYGDIGSSRYIFPAITIGGISEDFVSSISGIPKALTFEEESIVKYENRTDFEMAVPSAIFLGIIMLLFTSAIALIREVEAGTIRRLQISKVSSFELLTAVTTSQLLIGVTSIILTLITAIKLLHAKSQGPLFSVCVISILCCISIIAIGFILASFSRNVSDILLIGNLPYFILFLLSGAFPVPRINILTFGSHSIAVNDIFPTTPAMTALKMIMDQGKGLNEVMFEIIMMVILTILDFVLGIYLFNRKHMRLT